MQLLQTHELVATVHILGEICCNDPVDITPIPAAPPKPIQASPFLGTHITAAMAFDSAIDPGSFKRWAIFITIMVFRMTRIPLLAVGGCHYV
jgi:hypothetical protein